MFKTIFSFCWISLYSLTAYSQARNENGLSVESEQKELKTENKDSLVFNSEQIISVPVSNAQKECFKLEGFMNKKDEKSGREIYYNPSTGSFLQAVHFENAKQEKFCAAMDEKYYTKNQFKLISSETFVNKNQIKGTVYKVSYVFKNELFYRYIIYAGDESQMLWITLTGKEKSDESAKKTILELKQSLTLAPYKR
jgi:hypothetical protein